jgi:hypothetical protein
MATTSQPAAEDALLALMLADATLQSVGPPQIFTPAAMKKEHTWISENSHETQVAVLTAGTPALVQREEDYDIHVIIAVEKLGNDYTAIRDRGVALAAALENLIRNNSTLTGTVFYAEYMGHDRRSGTADRQRWVDFDITIHCNAFVTGA